MLLHWRRFLLFALQISIIDCSDETFFEWQYRVFGVEKDLPTRGEAWPKPFSEEKQALTYMLPPNITFKVVGNDCRLIHKAIQRIQEYINILAVLNKRFEKISKGASFSEEVKIAKSTVTEVLIDLKNACDDGYPQLDMDESYEITVSQISTLASSSIWGIIRGIETLSQLIYLSRDSRKIMIKGTHIIDKPQYAHRGLLLNTAIYYISVSNIKKTLDAMAMNKMNVFHWHMYDDQSFPYQSQMYPELSKQGALNSKKIYTSEAIETLVEYARDRGIRIIMEAGVPAHAESIKLSHPEIFTSCEENSYSKPIDPINQKTYNFLKGLLKELQNLFPDNHFHLGGDEVDAGCWLSSEKIKSFMKEHGYENDLQLMDDEGTLQTTRKVSPQLMNMFLTKIISFLRNGTTPVFWEDQSRSNVKLPKNSVVQCWLGNGAEIVQVLRKGLKAIQSASTNYNLDLIDRTFEHFYIHDPRITATELMDDNGIVDKFNAEDIIGGEACLWTERLKKDILLNDFIWPRASATAEVLWSYTKNKYPDRHTLDRIHEHMCRMARRGLMFTFTVRYCPM